MIQNFFMNEKNQSSKLIKSNAVKFIVYLGIVSLFADITYEGARSITGQYLAILGASGAVVGVVSGFGEMIGYAFRLVSGVVSDRTKKYWPLTFLGYILTLFSVPLLAFTTHWQTASVLIILERFGKAIRSPSKDAMLSFAARQVGTGWGFGLHQLLDQTGAVVGPLLILLVLSFHEGYPLAFLILLIPSIFAIALLVLARFKFPAPHELEVKVLTLKKEKFSKAYWIYLIGISLVGCGFIDFALIAYHFQKTSSLNTLSIPLFYAIAMGISGLSAFYLGRLFDVKGIPVLIGITFFSSFFVLAFLKSFIFQLLGMMLWGIGLGFHTSIMKAFVANIVPPQKRGTAYGILNFSFGLFWFIGSSLMGFLYDISLTGLIIFSLLTQWSSLPFFFYLNRYKQEGIEKVQDGKRAS